MSGGPLRGLERGEALVEYAILTAAMVLLIVFGMTAPIAGRGRSLLGLLFEGLTVSFESWAFILSLPIP